jgi:uncharacterized membrane protein YvbJ
MRDLTCKHCGGVVNAGDKNCPHCGIPLPPDFDKDPRRKFVLFFIALIVFCALLIIWLPRDLTHFIK